MKREKIKIKGSALENLQHEMWKNKQQEIVNTREASEVETKGHAVPGAGEDWNWLSPGGGH